MIFWNLFLAVIPCAVVYFASVPLKKQKWEKIKAGEKIALILFFLFWLFMFPNTAYLFAIPRHIVNYCSEINAYRVCVDNAKTWMVFFFFSYALLGVPTFYYALKKMQDIFRDLFSIKASKSLPVFVIPLTAVGVMFGLFQRFNSWDILFNPAILIQTAVSYFTDLNLFFTFIFFTVILFLIYYGTGYFINKIVK